MFLAISLGAFVVTVATASFIIETKFPQMGEKITRFFHEVN